MAARCLFQSLSAGKNSILSAVSRSYATPYSDVAFRNSSFLFRLRPLIAASCSSYFRPMSPAFPIRGFATRQTSSSLNDPNPNWSNRPPKETILLDGCDFEHWLVVMEKPEGDPTRDEIIDSYIKTLSMVVGSEEEARMKIYSVSTRHYFAFGALVSEELSYKLKELPKVRWVLPDSYLDVKNKDYGGEPFINGQAVPYDPKYHEEWVRNNNRANERNRRNDRPRNFDRSRNFERRQQMPNQSYGGNFGGSGSNMGSGAPPPNAGPVQSNYAPNMSPPTDAPGSAQSNMGGQPNYVPNMPPPPNATHPGQGQPNMGGQPNYVPNMPPPPNATHPGQGQPNMGGQPNYVTNMPPPPNATRPGQGQPNMGGYPSYGVGAPPSNPGYTRPPPNNISYQSGPNSGGAQYQQGPNSGGAYQTGLGGFAPRAGPNQGQYENPNFRPSPNSFTQPGSGPGQTYHTPNMAPNLGQNQHNGYVPGGGNQNAAPPQAQNSSSRDY